MSFGRIRLLRRPTPDGLGDRDITVVHLRGSPPPGWLPPSAANRTVILEAPQELTGELQSQDARVANAASSRDFRRRYYNAIHAFLSPRRCAWGETLSEDVRRLIEAAAVRVATKTWQDAELLLELSALLSDAGKGQRVHLVADNDVGARHYGLLKAVGGLIGIGHLTFRDLRDEGGGAQSLRHFARKGRDTAHTGLRYVGDVVGGLLSSRSSPLDPQRPHVVLCCDALTTWQGLSPVHWELRQRGAQVTVFTPRYPVARQAARSGATVAVAWPRPLPFGLRRKLIRTLSSLPVETGELDLSDRGLDVAFQRMLSLRLLSYAREAHTALAGTARIAKHARASCFVHAGDWSVWGHAITHQARRDGASSVLLPHGLIDYAAPEVPHYPPVDVFAAWGQAMQEGLEGANFPGSTRIVPLGNPIREQRLSPVAAGPDSGEGTEDAHRRTALVAFGRPSRVIRRERFEAAAGEIFDAASDFPETQFIIKVHPYDTSGFWTAMHRDRPLSNVHVGIDASFYDLLGAASLVITMHSTAGAEATCLNKPVIVVDIGSEDDDARRDPDFLTFGAAYLVSSPGQLVPTMKQLFAGDDPLEATRRAFAARFLTRDKESAAARMARYFIRMSES